MKCAICMKEETSQINPHDLEVHCTECPVCGQEFCLEDHECEEDHLGED